MIEVHAVGNRAGGSCKISRTKKPQAGMHQQQQPAAGQLAESGITKERAEKVSKAYANVVFTSKGNYYISLKVPYSRNT